jgi:ACS family hexuronate transporter-like MFS transporter
VICFLLFYITTANYNDRAVFSNLAPDLQQSIGWTQGQYWYLQVAFQSAYAISALFAGRLMDTLGLRLGFSLAVGFWGLAATGHSLASTTTHFFILRILLGLGEGGLFPAAVRAVAEWFPKRERALANSLFNCGSNFGAILVPFGLPLLLPVLMKISIAGQPLGWRGAFLLAGLFDLSWIVFWLQLYRKPSDHPRVNKAELDHILSEPPEPATKIAWRDLIPHRQTWAFAVAKGMTDGIWWFYLTGSPYFLADRFGLNLSARSLPIASIYILATVGSIAGGWSSGHLMRRGWGANAARKVTMLITAVLVVPIFTATLTSNPWVAVAVIALAAAAHQAWSANVLSLPSDMFPRRVIGSVTGLGGMVGAAGGVLLFVIVGRIRDQAVAQGTPGDYAPIFVGVSAAYLVALAIVHVLAPRLEPAKVEAAA